MTIKLNAADWADLTRAFRAAAAGDSEALARFNSEHTAEEADADNR